jgi:2-keto-3-deoxy-galactonokinase
MSSTIFAHEYSATTAAVAAAIRQSMGQDEIVRIVPGNHMQALMDELGAECEDWVEAGEETQYWGQDSDGQTWRVHVLQA